MTAGPVSWLPPLHMEEDFPTEEDWIEAAYKLFRADFVHSRAGFDGLVVTLQVGDGNGDGRGEAFWHLTSEKDRQTGKRERKPERCRRIRWPRPILDATGRPQIRVWTSTRPKRATRLLVAVDDFSYVVVMEKLPSSALLITAYDVPYRNQREDNRREWQAGRIILNGVSG